MENYIKINIFLILFMQISFANDQLSLDSIVKAEPRVHYKISDFKIITNIKNKHLNIKTQLIKDSIEWIRINDSLIIPRLILEIKVKDTLKNKKYSLKYQGRTYFFHQQNNSLLLRLYIFPYSKDKIEIFTDKKMTSSLMLLTKEKKDFHTIDYSCSAYNLKVEGLKDKAITIGCRTQRYGKIGDEKAYIELFWLSPHLINQSDDSINLSILTSSKPIYINTKDLKGHDVTFKIIGQYPERLNRLKTAIGFGPYHFETRYARETKNLNHKSKMAPSLMLYMNYHLNDNSGIRFFDALIMDKSTFNNAGLYYANNIASIFDKKLIITTLIGVQYLYFKYDDQSPLINEPIVPQGIEFLYKHAFGIENYIISGGIFLSPNINIDYQNIWLRWGKNYFWELNYIHWGKEQYDAKMWGLSLGIPFISLL